MFKHPVPICIIQMTDLRFMEDINNILYSGEVPNIFAIDEKQEIIENMRMLEKELDKSQHTDGSGPGKVFFIHVCGYTYIVIN